MLKPVCVPCQRFFRAKKNGFYFIEGMPKEGTIRPPEGKRSPEQWKPYKLWVGDLWECKGCGTQIISGVPNRPISEHYKSTFAELVKELGAELQVNDC